jgi:PAS domain S-box-containing protein
MERGSDASVFSGSLHRASVLGDRLEISGEHPATPRPIDLERLHAVVESSPAGTIMVDAKGTIVLVNREVERMFGYAREELLGRKVELLLPDPLRAGHPEHRSLFVANPQARRMGAGRDLFGRRKDGSEVPVEIGLTPVRTAEGLFVISSIIDISERKRAERERDRLEEQLRQSQKMEAVGTLAGGVAHDFNNILAAIVGYAELVRDACADRPPVVADVDEILHMARRGRHLVESILRFSRREAMERSPVDLAVVLAESETLLRATLPANVALRMQAGATPLPKVLADPVSLQQVLVNLATNSAHAMPRGGALDVRVEPTYVRDSVARGHPDLREGPYVVVSVSDTGMGMDPVTRARALEPFFTTKPPGQGTGLGLSVVHGIVRNHEGALDLVSAPDVGTMVKLYFPAIEGDEAPPASTEKAPDESSPLVLVVDDERRLADVTKRRLEKLGYRVVVATDPGKALAMFRQRSDEWAFMFVDYLMPGMNGLELAREVRRIRPEFPIALMSGYVGDLSTEEVEAAGIAILLRKPAMAEDVARTAEACAAMARARHV